MVITQNPQNFRAFKPTKKMCPRYNPSNFLVYIVFGRKGSPKIDFSCAGAGLARFRFISNLKPFGSLPSPPSPLLVTGTHSLGSLMFVYFFSSHRSFPFLWTRAAQPNVPGTLSSFGSLEFFRPAVRQKGKFPATVKDSFNFPPPPVSLQPSPDTFIMIYFVGPRNFKKGRFFSPPLCATRVVNRFPTLPFFTNGALKKKSSSGGANVLKTYPPKSGPTGPNKGVAITPFPPDFPQPVPHPLLLSPPARSPETSPCKTPRLRACQGFAGKESP